MKSSKVFLTAAISLFLTLSISSCKNEEVELVNQPSAECLELERAEMQLAENLKMYETVWDDIINKREIDQINETNFDKDVTIISLPENIVGVEGFKAYYQNYLTGFSDVTFTIVDAFGQGDNIVKHWNFKGTHTGDFFGIPASGRVVDIDGVTLVKMKDGKIAQEQDFMDNLSFYQQLGLMPEE